MRLDLVKTFQGKMNQDCVLGPFSKSSDPMFIEAVGYAGFDFVIIDLEHGPNTILNAQNLVRAAEASGILPVIRVKEDVRSVISEALDIGAGGVLVPKITTVRDAEEVMETARFAPEGMRGVCRYVRAAHYSSMDKNDYFKNANQAVLILGMEGVEALDNLEAILRLSGFTVLFIGPYDLSQSVGKTGQIDHPLVTEKMMKIIEKCKKNNVAVGTFVETVESAKRWRDLGVKFLAYSVDVGIFTEGCREIVTGFRSK